jgi:SAM-dependent methyltransferase
MHDTLRRLHGGQRGRGTTIDRYRLNEVVSQLAFGGRRGRVYRRIVALSGVRPGDSVLDVGSSSGYLARKLAAAAGPAGHVTGVDPSAAAIAYARRRARRAMTFAVGVAQDLDLPDASFDVVTCTLAMHHYPGAQAGGGVRRDVPGDQARRTPAGRGLRSVAAAALAASGRTPDAARLGQRRLA